MRVSQEPKYAIDYDANDVPCVVNRATGDPIPDDEPIFIFRAKDLKSIDALAAYLSACSDRVHRVAIIKRIEAFAVYQAENPALCGEPNTEMWPVDE